MDKKAYPQNIKDSFIDTPYNIKKWMNSMQQIYSQSAVIGWNNSFNQITAGWDNMEKEDFKKWMSFYQEDSHNKYKTAQYIENGGSFIPVDHLKATLPSKQPNMSLFTPNKDINNNDEKENQRLLVERKIQSLIGRLNSAEKIATNPHVQLALKKSLLMSVDDWVSLLQKLKREIQLVPMRVTTATLIDDIIYKNANQILSYGYSQAAHMLIKVAQTTPSTTSPSQSMNPIDSPMGGQPLPPMEGNPPESLPIESSNTNESNDDEAITKFLKNLNNIDISEVDDTGKSEEDEIVVTAQATDVPTISPQVEPNNIPQQNVESEQPLEVHENEVPEISNEIPEVPEVTLPSGDPFDQALSNVKTSDIISRLEGIASMFKNRQIARQLSIIDLMMDKIGIAPFFPTLAEAMRSALESNQYCQSRVEEILAKLRGTIVTPMSAHLQGEVSGENDLKEDQVKAQLAQQEQDEKDRKERRKQIQEQQEVEALEPPQPQQEIVNAPQELAVPSKVKSAPPLRPTQI
jgi:hypothetical protein